ncbi:FkbM family methyltransferase [Fischerella sp. PCC 9605]|uniref:FkbM family methyltransferase n=1 Tax=Fischerella sp. PCC 9605 TaxID=1173024 RepID=UPI000478A7DF|nr:FkbM family methyltransferase [Fischerella sp. PCC 9605]
MNSLLSLWKTVRQTLHEVRQAWSLAGDFSSRLRLVSDLVLYRILKVIDLKSRNQERTIRCSNGLVLTYRLNRGDIQSIREVWLDDAYRLPFSLKPGLVVDLGANIGLTSLWLHQQYGCDKIIAIEPNPSNAQLVRKNLINNKINATVIEAAIGPTDGVVTFESSQDSNMGRVAVNGEQATTGEQVKMISMTTLLAELPHDQEVDLVKLDIEGGEQQLLSGNLSWLKRVKAIIAEFHPEVVDYPGLIKTIQQQEFQYIPAHTLDHDNMDAFVRESIAASVLAG